MPAFHGDGESNEDVDGPMHDEATTGTLRPICDRCSAENVEAWCRSIDDQG